MNYYKSITRFDVHATRRILMQFVCGIFRLPGNLLFVFSIVCGAYLVARKFKKVNPATSYSVSRIFFILSFAFLGASLVAYIYTFIIIKYFRKTEGKIKKAIFAALTPGLIFPLTAIDHFGGRKHVSFLEVSRGTKRKHCGHSNCCSAMADSA